MFVGRISDGDVIIAQVMPGTPADSVGIAAGDVLVRVGGMDAKALGLDAVRARFRQPGRIDTLIVAHEGRERSLVLRQTDLP